jgi:hypothetical protein
VLVEVSGIDAVLIRFRRFRRLRSAGPAPLTSLVVPTMMASLVPAATAVAFAAPVRRAETIAGTHDELLAAGGHDANLYRIQAAVYATA